MLSERYCGVSNRFGLSKTVILQLYIAEADGIPEYSSTMSLGKRLVAIKFLGESAFEKEK